MIIITDEIGLEEYFRFDEQGNQLQHHEVCRDNLADIVFTGTVIGVANWQLSVATEECYETDLSAVLYRTESGKYICEQSQGQPDSEEPIMTGAVADNHNEVVTFYGLDYRFKEFYKQLKLDKSSYEIQVE